MKYITFFSFFYLIAIAGIANAGVINISLDATDWKADINPTWIPYHLNASSANTAEGLRVQANSYGGGRGYGAFMQTTSSYDLQNSVLRYKWKATSSLYSNIWGGLESWIGIGGGFTTHHSWSGSQHIASNTWLITEIAFNDDLSYSWNVGYDGSSTLRSASGVLSQSFYDDLSNQYFRFSVNDNYQAGAAFVLAEAFITTPDENTGNLTIPEPSSLALIALGLFGIGYKRIMDKK